MCAVKTSRGTNVFVFGGHDGTSSLNDIHSLVTLTWSSIDSAENAPYSRLGHTLSTIGNKIYLIGGASDDVCYNDCRVYDMLKNEWSVPALTGEPPTVRPVLASVRV